LVTALGAAIAGPILFGSAAKASKLKTKKLRHAAIGLGGMGVNDLENFINHPQVEIVALCDVDENNLKKAAQMVPDARTYIDWREMIKKEKDFIDSINVAVPDHSHYVISMKAIKAGKHVYCQKPLCHDVAEVRALTNAAIRAGVITQLGTQHASGIGDRTAVQWIKKGAISKIKHVYLCSNRPGAIAWGAMTESYFGKSCPMTETVLLGTVAIRVPGQILKWDAQKLKFPNFPEAEKYLKRKYRKGWS